MKTRDSSFFFGIFQTESGGFVILKIFKKPELEVVNKIK
jgi:hypothetical protein